MAVLQLMTGYGPSGSTMTWRTGETICTSKWKQLGSVGGKKFDLFSGHWQYIFIATLCFSGNQGTLLYFPNLVATCGGLYFFIPVLTWYAIYGYPIMMIYAILGRYYPYGPLTVFENLCPVATGLGVCLLYYTVFNVVFKTFGAAVLIHHFIHAFDEKLDWFEEDFSNEKCPILTPHDYHLIGVFKFCGHSWENVGSIVPMLLLCYALAWFIGFTMTMAQFHAGMKLLQRMTYPFFVGLLFFAILGLTTDGGINAMKTLFHPDHVALLTSETWVKALNLVTYSAHLYGAGYLYLASCYQGGDVAFTQVGIIFFDLLAKVLICIVYFGLYGKMVAGSTGQTFSEFTKHDFVENVTESFFNWSVPHMLTIFLLITFLATCYGEIVTGIASVVNSIYWKYGWARHHRFQICTWSCVIMFLLTFYPLCTNYGHDYAYIIERSISYPQIVAHMAVTIAAFNMGMGTDKFQDLLQRQAVNLGSFGRHYLFCCVQYVTPSALIVSLIVMLTGTDEDGKIEVHFSADLFQLLIALTPAVIMIYCSYASYATNGSLAKIFVCTKKWKKMQLEE